LETRGNAVRLPLGFAGGLFDADTGLTRFVWRDYDADTGRFTALDPMGAKGGDSDWYGYCVDDPVNRVDVWGLMGVVWELPTAVLTKVARFIRDKLGLNPMPMERVIKEIADEEIVRREDNSTDERPSQRQWEDLKNDMDENGVPSPWEAGARLLKDKGLWPF